MKLNEISNRRLVITFSLAAALIVMTGWASMPVWKVFFKSNALSYATIPLESLALAALFVLPVFIVISKTVGFSTTHLKKPWRRYVRFLLLVAILVVGNLFLNTFGYFLTSWHYPEIRLSIFKHAQGMLGLLLFLCIFASYFIGIYLWHSELDKPKQRRIIYYTATSLPGLLLFYLLSTGQLFYGVNETFFDLFTVLRGDRLASKPVTILQLRSGRLSEDRFTKYLAMIADLGPSVIAVPAGGSTWDSTAIQTMRTTLPLDRFIWPSFYESFRQTDVRTGDVVPPSVEAIRMVYSPALDFSNDMAMAVVKEHAARMKTDFRNIKIPATKRGRILVNHYVIPRDVVPRPFMEKRDRLYWLGLTDFSRDEPAALPKAKGSPEIRNNILVVKSSDQPLFQSPEYAIATVAQNMIDGDTLEETSISENFLFAIVFLLVLGVIYSLIDRWKALGVSAAFAVLTFVLLCVVFVRYATLVDPSFAVFGFLFSLVCFFPYEIAAERRNLLEERTRLSTELRTAHDMQMGLMPKDDPIVPGFDISGICLPASDVGGDFFDYVWLDGKRRKLGIAVADVSGKAMKAAITAVMTSGMIYREAGGNESPKTILRNINRPMYTKLDSRMFTALSFAVIDTRKKELRFSNAGQSYPFLKRGKEVRSLEVKGARLPLGVKEDVTYGEMAVKLKKGDTLIFYTDGIPEAKDEKDEFYGLERFKSLMENLDGLLAKELRDRILSEVKSFTGNAPQHDDMTVVVVRVN